MREGHCRRTIRRSLILSFTYFLWYSDKKGSYSYFKWKYGWIPYYEYYFLPSEFVRRGWSTESCVGCSMTPHFILKSSRVHMKIKPGGFIDCWKLAQEGGVDLALRARLQDKKKRLSIELRADSQEKKEIGSVISMRSLIFRLSQMLFLW